MYTGASYGTWIRPRNPHVAHGARPWESRVFTTSITPAFWTCVPLVHCTTHTCCWFRTLRSCPLNMAFYVVDLEEDY
eukprot:187775-Prorocentrum_minimum.AAC.1